MNKIKTYSQFLNESTNQLYVKLIPEEDKLKAIELCHSVSRDSDAASFGSPTLGLYKGDVLVGCLCLDEDILEYGEYRFDILIKRHYRGKGGGKLLISEMFKMFNEDDNIKVISADVVNPILCKYLIDVWGFEVQRDYPEEGIDRVDYRKN